MKSRASHGRERAAARRGAASAPPVARASSSTFWRAVFWTLPAVLAIVQWRADAAGLHEIRYEELAESVRNVYWLNQRLVYDGISSNVGWYGLLLVVYKIFGFSIGMAKHVRLGLSLVGLICVADLLRRWMGEQRAIVPLLAAGLSPTLLYLNTLQTSYGVDVPYAWMCLWLIVSIRRDAWTPLDAAKAVACGAIAMIAAMSYPTFLFYLPALLLVAIWRLRPGEGGAPGWRVALLQTVAALVGFVLPLAAAAAFLRNPGLLVYDSATHAGLFRGGAQVGWNATVLAQSISTVMGDLFSHGQSYYFELTRPDFSGVLGTTTAVVVAALAVYAAAVEASLRPWLAAAGLLLAANLVGPNISVSGPPGIRRGTGLLVAWLVMVTMVWRVSVSTRAAWRWAGIAACALVVLDSALKLPSLFDDLRGDSAYRDTTWFAIEPTPAQSLDRLMRQLDQGQGLACPVDQERRILPCRYQEIYAAMAGWRAWNNHQPSAAISALDWKTGQTITLSTSLWADYYFPH